MMCMACVVVQLGAKRLVRVGLAAWTFLFSHLFRKYPPLLNLNSTHAVDQLLICC
jgi:hypothetical protein